jgi:hypothetical protein
VGTIGGVTAIGDARFLPWLGLSPGAPAVPPLTILAATRNGVSKDFIIIIVI